MSSIFYTDGKFFTGDGRYVDSLFSKDGKVVAVGSMEEIGGYKNEADKIVRMEDRFVYPDYTGFIEEVEYDFNDIGDDLLTLYDKKQAKKVIAGQATEGFKPGDDTNLTVYTENLLKTVPGKCFEVRKLVLKDQVIYDEEEYLEEQWYEMLLTQQF